MKTSFFVESEGRQAEEKELIARIKEIWVSEGKLIKDINTLKLYAKPADNACYYTINDDIEGKVDLYE